jgi:glycosyltransferase involved in cell wall biosynthesis
MIDPYIFFIGRIHPEKGTALAIRTVVELNKRGVQVKLKIAGGCALGSQEYFDETVLQGLKEYPDIVEYKGEVDFDQKNTLYGGALLTIAPLGCELAGRAWFEPNGLTIDESLSCGTPVLVGDKASAPELVQHKSTGFRVPIHKHDSDELLAERFADGAEWVMKHPLRNQARRYAQQWFTVERMVKGYQGMYRKFLSGNRAYAFV